MTYANRDMILVALADPTRCAVFEAVAKAPKPVSEIAKGFEVSRPAVSQHLKVLSDAGLVTATKKGRYQIYRARRDGLAPLHDWLNGLWDDVLTAFADHIESEGTSDGL